MACFGDNPARVDRWHYLIWPSAVFLLLVVLFALVPVDRWLADELYHLEGGNWALRDAWLTSTLIHEYGRKLVLAVVLLMLIMTGLSYIVQDLRPYRPGLIYVITTAIVSGLLINIMKEFTHMDCPWDLVHYGGDRSYHSLLDFSGYARAKGRCFPAGHASAAYAWFGFYFFALRYFPRYRWPVLGLVIMFGLVFGIGQQLRGAHFLSHDLWTAWLCWITAASMARYTFIPDKRPVSGRGGNVMKKECFD